MTAFANKEASEARSLARQRQVADADGFITVTRGGRTNPARQEVAQEQAEKQKEKQKGLEDFYRFQSREKRKQRAAELVRKFEEDKEKVRKMKERRGRFRVGHSSRFPHRMLMVVCSLNKPNSDKFHSENRYRVSLWGQFEDVVYISTPALFYLVSPPDTTGFAANSSLSNVHTT